MVFPDPMVHFDLDQLIPGEELFKVRGREIGIAPVFSVADNARYARIEQRLQYERALMAEQQRRLVAYHAARIEAERDGTTLPDAPAEVARDPVNQPYTMDLFERDTLELLARIWQASEAAKLPEQRVDVTTALVRETFTQTQAWAVVQRLWPRRNGLRTAAPAEPPSAPETATPEPPKAIKRSRRSSTAS